MEKLINDIKKRIQLEKLLFNEQKEYTKEEIKFIGLESLKILQTEECYMNIFYPFIPKLLNLYSKYGGTGFERELYKLGIEVGKFISLPNDEKENNKFAAYFLYNNFIGLPQNETYYDFVKNRMMDVTKVKEVLNDGKAYELYNNDLNFLLTNNFLFIHYPEIYTLEDLSQLKMIAINIDKTKFVNKQDYNNFKTAAHATTSRIRRFEKNNYVKVKTKTKKV